MTVTGSTSCFYWYFGKFGIIIDSYSMYLTFSTVFGEFRIIIDSYRINHRVFLVFGRIWIIIDSYRAYFLCEPFLIIISWIYIDSDRHILCANKEKRQTDRQGADRQQQRLSRNKSLQKYDHTFAQISFIFVFPAMLYVSRYEEWNAVFLSSWPGKGILCDLYFSLFRM